VTEPNWWIVTIYDGQERCNRLWVARGARDEAQALTLVKRVLKPREAVMGAQKAVGCVETDVATKPPPSPFCEECTDEMCAECLAQLDRVFSRPPARLSCVLCREVAGEDDGVRCRDCQAFMCSCAGGEMVRCPECEQDRAAEAAESRAELRREAEADDYDESSHINHHNPDR